MGVEQNQLNMKQTTFIFLLFQIIILTCAKNLQKRQITVDPQLARQLTFSLSKGLNQFNHDLFPKLAALNDGNIVISPFSLHTALSMTLIGTPTKSDTHKQLSRALLVKINLTTKQQKQGW